MTNSNITRQPLNNDALLAVSALAQARAEIKRLKKIEDECKAVITEALKGRSEGTKDGVTVVKRAMRPRSDIDRDLLLSEFPEVYEATKRSTEYPVISVV